MKRLKRCYKLIALSCLLLSTLLAVFWCRSIFADRPDQLLTWRSGETRYTLRSQSGRIALRHPRRVSNSQNLAALVSQLSNDEILWSAMTRWTTGNSIWFSGFGPSGFTATTGAVIYQVLSKQPHAVRIAFMLDALEDPHRFAVAHLWLLQETHKNGALPYEGASKDAIPMFCILKGLRVEFRPVTPPRPKALRIYQLRDGPYEVPTNTYIQGEPYVHIDPAQRPAIRRHWHDLLDVDAYSISYAIPVCALALPPLVWLAFEWRRRRAAARRVAGLCVNCGYDLRASGDRCPECGSSVNAAPHNPVPLTQ